ncbi:MAG: hypothetical protein AB3N23_20340 [Paracoccaceae bacterium]
MKTIKDLLLALVNATLILIALCLFLGLQVVNRANDITATFASNLVKLEPVKAEVAGVREEVAGLRADLQTLQAGSGELSSAALAGLETRLDAVSGRLDGMQATVQEVKSLPYDLTDHAIEKAAQEFGAIALRFAPAQIED